MGCGRAAQPQATNVNDRPTPQRVLFTARLLPIKVGTAETPQYRGAFNACQGQRAAAGSRALGAEDEEMAGGAGTAPGSRPIRCSTRFSVAPHARAGS